MNLAAKFTNVLRLLTEARVEFILVGGLAANLHGTARVTYDLDVVYSRRTENLQRLVDCLAAFEPYLRGAPAGLPFRWDLSTMRHGLNFTLTTSLGPLDLLGEIAGGGTYEELLSDSENAEAAGLAFRCVSLRKLIDLKRASGRPKDLEAIAELEALLQEQSR